jgi:hypothetical protein
MRYYLTIMVANFPRIFIAFRALSPSACRAVMTLKGTIRRLRRNVRPYGFLVGSA